MRSVLEPIFEAAFSEELWSSDRTEDADALRAVAAMLKEGFCYVIDADLKSYFDTIPRGQLMKLVRTRIADGRVLSLVESYLQQGVSEEMREWIPEQGTPQGAVISPMLANLASTRWTSGWRRRASEWCGTPTTSW